MASNARTMRIPIVLAMIAMAPGAGGSERAPSAPQTGCGVGSWKEQNAGKSYSVIDKGEITRFEVHPGDRWCPDIGTIDRKERSEIATLMPMSLTEPFTISYDFRFPKPSQFDGSWAIVAQLQMQLPMHVRRGPAIRQEVRSGKWSVIVEQIADGAKRTERVLSSQQINSDWHHVEWRVSGFYNTAKPDRTLTLTVDNTEVSKFDQFYPDERAISYYFKYGIYRPATAWPQIIEFKNVAVSIYKP